MQLDKQCKYISKTLKSLGLISGKGFCTIGYSPAATSRPLHWSYSFSWSKAVFQSMSCITIEKSHTECGSSDHFITNFIFISTIFWQLCTITFNFLNFVKYCLLFVDPWQSAIKVQAQKNVNKAYWKSRVTQTINSSLYAPNFS